MSFNIGPTSPANRPVQTNPVPADPAPAGRTAATKPGNPLTESWKATLAQSKPLFALRVLFNLTIVGAAIDAVATTVGHKLGNLGQNAAPVAPTRQASSNAEVLARDRAAARARLATAGTPSQRAGGAELSAPKVARHAEAIAAMPDITRAALSVFRELPDAPPGTIMTQTNPIRSNTLSGTTRDQVVDQTLANGAGSLPFAQAINVPSNVWAGESVLPPNLVAEMARLESLPHSLGAMTFNNTMGTRDVRDNTPAQRFEAALQLREFIQTKLNPEQRAALKDRIDFLAELPPLMLQKFGAPSHLELGKPDQALAVWMKSLGVTGYSYLGLAVTNLEEVMGQPKTQSAILINDALVAMVLHRDVVFAASDPAALSAGIATAEKSLAILQTRLANVGDFEALNTPAHFDALRTEVTKQVRDLSGASPERPQGTLGLHDVITRYASVYQKAAEGDAAASRELPQLRRTLEQAGYSTVGATGQGRSFDAAFKELHLSITALVENTPLQEARTEARTLSRKIEEQETHLATLEEKHAASVRDVGAPALPADAPASALPAPPVGAGVSAPAQEAPAPQAAAAANLTTSAPLPARVASLPAALQTKYQQLVAVMSPADALGIVAAYQQDIAALPSRQRDEYEDLIRVGMAVDDAFTALNLDRAVRPANPATAAITMNVVPGDYVDPATSGLLRFGQFVAAQQTAAIAAGLARIEGEGDQRTVVLTSAATPAPAAPASANPALPARVALLPLTLQAQYQQLVSAQIMSADDAFALVTDQRRPAPAAAVPVPPPAAPAPATNPLPALVQAAIANQSPATTRAVLDALLDPAVPAAEKQAIRTGLHQALTAELTGKTGEAATAVLNRWSAALLYSAGQQAIALALADEVRSANYVREQALETAIRQNLQNRTGGNVEDILVQNRFSGEAEVQLGLSDRPALARAGQAFALGSSGNQGIEGLIQQAMLHGAQHPGQPLFAALNTGRHWVSTTSILDPATGRLQLSVVDTDFQPGNTGYVNGQPAWVTTLSSQLVRAGADGSLDYRGFDLQSNGRAGNACGPFTCMVQRDLARQMGDAQTAGLPPPPVRTMVDRWAQGWQSLAESDQQVRIADERTMMFHQVHRGLVESGLGT